MKKTKIILLLCMIALCALSIALLVGCNIGGVQYEYDYLVTFNYNVDNLGVATNCKDQYLGVNDGDKLIAPGDNDKFKFITVNNFYNKGWYTAVLDDKGNPVKDADGNIVLDKQWDFKKDVVKGNMTLYEKKKKNPTLTIKVEGGNDLVVTKLPGEVYNKPVSDKNKPQKDGFTFIDYYTDETYTTKFQFPYTFTEDDEVCYALLLEGDWDIVTSVASFRSALSRKHNMFIDVPKGELDFADTLFRDGQFNLGYNGKIYGHGCVLKNINISATYNRATKEKDFSFFGNLGPDAEINDITFENLTFAVDVSGTDSPDLRISLFATDIANGAQLNNVTITNCTLNYKGSTNYVIDTYGYYITSAQTYECFDPSQLTVKNEIVALS